MRGNEGAVEVFSRSDSDHQSSSWRLMALRLNALLQTVRWSCSLMAWFELPVRSSESHMALWNGVSSSSNAFCCHSSITPSSSLPRRLRRLRLFPPSRGPCAGSFWHTIRSVMYTRPAVMEAIDGWWEEWWMLGINNSWWREETDQQEQKQLDLQTQKHDDHDHEHDHEHEHEHDHDHDQERFERRKSFKDHKNEIYSDFSFIWIKLFLLWWKHQVIVCKDLYFFSAHNKSKCRD